jgi:hypothetical protein
MGTGVQNIILAPGSRHLFWTGGAYYLWELSKKYNVVMLVDQEFSNDLDFLKLMELTGVLRVFYIPKVAIINRHRFYATNVKRIVSEYNPAFIFHHDPVYASMMYLYHWATKEKARCIRISYLTAICNEDWDRGVEEIVTFNVNVIRRKYNIPYRWAAFLFKAKSRLYLILNYYLLPLMFIGKYFSPPLNTLDFTKLKKYWNDQFDYYLLYGVSDKEIISRLFGSEKGIKQINHPIQSVGNELNSLLYNCVETNTILILPTYGHVDVYMKKTGISSDEILNRISSKWIQLIDVLKLKFPNHPICWKLHPAQADDSLWHNIQDKIKQKHPDISIIRLDENAQKWILKSKIIVGEVTAALWWASFFPSKITVSLDIFEIPFMDTFKDRGGIYYFNSLKDFLNADFARRHPSDKRPDSSHPTLTEFLECISVK